MNSDLRKALFSFDGRIGRTNFWLTIVPVFVALNLIAYTPLLMVGTESEEMPPSFLVAAFAAQLIWLAGLWPLLAVGSKRLHDRDKRGWWLLVFWILPFLLFFGGFGHDFLDDPAKVQRGGIFTTGLLMIYVSLLIALWGIVELGILPGTKGPNRFGAEPTQRPA